MVALLLMDLGLQIIAVKEAKCVGEGRHTLLEKAWEKVFRCVFWKVMCKGMHFLLFKEPFLLFPISLHLELYVLSWTL